MKTKVRTLQNKLKPIIDKFGEFINWRDLRIGYKYLLSFSIVTILFIASVLIVYFQLSIVETNINQIEEDSIRTHELEQMATLIQKKDIHIADYIITNDEQYIEQYEQTLEEFNQLVEKVEPAMRTEQQKNLFNVIMDFDNRMNDIFEDIIEEENTSDRMTKLRREQTNRTRMAVDDGINMLIEYTFEDQAESVASAKSSISYSIFALIIASGLAIIIGVTIVAIVSRRISNNLRKVVDLTSTMAEGNLAIEDMDYKGRDEIGQLSNSVNRMKNSIRNIITKVAEASQLVTARSEELTQSANEVNEGGVQISSTMQELSSGAENQANSAANLSEGMNDFVEIVQASEQEGQNVSRASSQVLDLTTEGRNLMAQSVEQMRRIDEIVSQSVAQVQGLDKQSSQISQLVQVIKDIADQTNLLALNAAIEAARAGEHGRGFAVVAEEVRNLSEQVASSVSEITHIVNEIQHETDQVVTSLNAGYEEVKEGTEQIEKTGESFLTIESSVTDMIDKIVAISNNLKNIATNSDHMNDLIQDIASVSEESAAGVEQAAATVQQTSSAMDEISSSADELAKLAEQLNDEIQTFKLN